MQCVMQLCSWGQSREGSLYLVFVRVFFNRDMFGSPGGIESSLELRIKEKKKSCVCLLDV